MINFLLGAPGGGKSYEAVVFHVLPALAKGRKVITNLALHVDELEKLFPGASGLIELRTATKAARPVEGQVRNAWRERMGLPAPVFNAAAFSHVEDYGDPWRDASTGVGPLYIIDEAHLALPARGTPVPVEEWYSLHRHEFADVLLISQSYGKVNRAVRDLVQVVYRVRKNVALGSKGSYTRKVQDGLKGAVVNTAVRRYEKKYFALYRSHTRSGVGLEAGAEDIIPIWRNWTVYGIGVCILVFAGVWIVRGNPFAVFLQKKPATVHKVAARSDWERLPNGAERYVGPAKGPDKAKEAASKPATPKASAAVSRRAGWPYGELQLHIGGRWHTAERDLLVVVFTQNGQEVFEQGSDQLQQAGYTVVILNDCLAKVSYGKLSEFIKCDAPHVEMGGVASRGGENSPAAAKPGA